MPLPRHLACILLLALSVPAAGAGFESWRIDELYSSADGSRQFVVLKEAQAMDGMNLLTGHTLTFTHAGVTKTFRFAFDLPNAFTSKRSVLIATQAVTAHITPDYVMPDRFLATDGGTLDFAGVDSISYPMLPTDGENALYAATLPGPRTDPNIATNFAGHVGAVPAGLVSVVEFYNRDLDHYFMSPLAPDIDALDTGHFAGWERTGLTFQATAALPSVSVPLLPGGDGINPVCRFFIPPEHGNSHFFSASPADCGQILQWIPTNPSFSGYIYETPNAFYIALADIGNGACPAGTFPVYRLWNQRFDSNHRFTIDPVIKAQMIARGYVAEGYGTDQANMCAVASGQPDPQFRASATSPFTPGCDGVVSAGTLYANAEVEPMIAVNPTNPSNLVGVWQQDRWSDGGARGLLTGYSFDGGRTWARTAAAFSRCTGGNAFNGGDYERASDPWVTFAPDGTAFQSSLSFNGQINAAGSASAILVSRSSDGGKTWSVPTALIRDGASAFNDKDAITADPTDARFVYATWDRLAGNSGPSYLARSTDGGVTWEPARSIFNPGGNNQTLNNQIAVLPDGTLINFFTLFNPNPSLAVLRSTDKGLTWSAPFIIAQVQALGATDPENGTAVRDSSTLGSIAVSRQGTLYVTWQDARFSGGLRDGILVSASSDRGITWSVPARINGVPAVQAFSPTVAVRDDGTIGVSYYDFRNNTADPSTLLTDVWLAQSSDGITWRESHLNGPFDLSIAPDAEGLFLGDYHALAGIGTTFVPFYVRTNDGHPENRTDVFSGLVNAAGTAAKSAQVQSEAMPAAAAPAATPTMELTQRLQATAQRVIARRVPPSFALTPDSPR